jgi:polyisoprenyl-teichoic acid--peptidoglycan teichoic acid transferase
MPSSPRRRRRAFRGASAVVLFTATAGGIAFAGTFHVGQRLDSIGRIDLGATLHSVPPVTDPATGATSSTDPPTGAINYLLVGSDTRAGAKSSDADYGSMGNEGAGSGQRSDTIMILRLDAAGGASLLSLPRDLYVPIAGSNTQNRINTAFSMSAQTLVKTIEQDFSIPIDHYVEVDFQGFKRLIDAIGGVTLCFSAPARDLNTGLRVNAGCWTLKGVQALQYARSRHYEELHNGHWQVDGSADLGRIKRQQKFIKVAIDKAIAVGLHSPLTINNLLDAIVGNMTIDKGLSRSDMARLAKEVGNLSGDQLQTFTVPGTSAMIHGMSVLQIDTTAAEPILARFR